MRESTCLYTFVEHEKTEKKDAYIYIYMYVHICLQVILYICTWLCGTCEIKKRKKRNGMFISTGNGMPVEVDSECSIAIYTPDHPSFIALLLSSSKHIRFVGEIELYK